MDAGLSVEEMRLAWRVLNRACFDSMLTEPLFTYGPSEWEDPVCGVYYPNPGGQPRIHIDPRCQTLESIMATMAHEMIHQLQDHTGRPTHHGNYFRSWGAQIKKQTGIIV